MKAGGKLSKIHDDLVFPTILLLNPLSPPRIGVGRFLVWFWLAAAVFVVELRLVVVPTNLRRGPFVFRK